MDDSASVCTSNGSVQERGGSSRQQQQRRRSERPFSSSATMAKRQQRQQQQLLKQYRSAQPNQNWLARFLHIRPASRAICFTVPRGRARREIAVLLRGWKKYGLRDVVVIREENLIFGRVDAQNSEFFIDPRALSRPLYSLFPPSYIYAKFDSYCFVSFSCCSPEYQTGVVCMRGLHGI